jgi:phage anti-repressor protein
MSTFSIALAKQLVQDSENEEFVVDFNELWQWCGYSTKASAKRTLDSNLESGYDFSTMMLKTPAGGRPSELVLLTIDAAKEFAMLAQTPVGKKVRKYFIEAEKELRMRTGRKSKDVQPVNPLDALIEGLKLTRELQQRVDKLEEKAERADNYLPKPGYYSITSWCKLNNYKAIGKAGSLIGITATKACRERDIEIVRIEDPVRGTVNTYPQEIIGASIGSLIATNKINLAKKRKLTHLSVSN